VLLEYESGPIASINTTYFAPPVVSLSVFGSDAAAWNEEDGSRLYTQLRSDPGRTEHEVETIDTMQDEIVEFARCIAGEAEPETGMPEAIEVAAVLEAIGRSVASGSVVELAHLR
jgi:predicted dehydrogenase